MDSMYPADVLTKGLQPSQHARHTDFLLNDTRHTHHPLVVKAPFAHLGPAYRHLQQLKSRPLPMNRPLPRMIAAAGWRARARACISSI